MKTLKKKPEKAQSESIRARELLSQRPFFHFREAEKLGLPQWELSRAVANGEFARCGKGYYYPPTFEWENPVELDFAVAQKLFGKNAYIGGASAFGYYNLLDATARQIWVVVPLGVKTVQTRYRLIRSSVNKKHGIVETEHFRIASIERCILDAFYFSYIWGKGTAFRAAKEALESGKTSVEQIEVLAKKLGYENYMAKYREFISYESLGL